MKHPEDSYRDNQLDDHLEKGVRCNAISLPDDPWSRSLFAAAESVDDLEPEKPRTQAYYDGLNREREAENERIVANFNANRKIDQIAKLGKVQA